VRSFVDNETVTGSDKERNALVRERRKAAANDLFYKFVREELSDDLRIVSLKNLIEIIITFTFLIILNFHYFQKFIKI
jgi:hypothetical protein